MKRKNRQSIIPLAVKEHNILTAYYNDTHKKIVAVSQAFAPAQSLTKCSHVFKGAVTSFKDI